MKALTLHQPWASLVALGVKRIETRSWRTSYRGPLAIHAARRMPHSAERVGDYNVRGFGRTGLALEGPGLPRFRSTPRLEGYLLPTGAVVAVATLVDVVPMVDRWPSPTRGPELPCLYAGDKWPLALWRSGSNHFPSERVEEERPYGDFTPGRYAWLLADVVAVLPPVKAKGRQGLWNWSET